MDRAQDSSTEGRFKRSELVIAVIDLDGFTQASRSREDLKLAGFLDAFYTACFETSTRAQGRLIKTMGDACLMCFPPERAVEAIECVMALRQRVQELAASHAMPVGPGLANLHLAPVAEGEFGPPGASQYDIIGEGVNQTFLMRCGGGVHISEALYQALPEEARAHCRPSARTYTWQTPETD